jgi:hypothetical protein
MSPVLRSLVAAMALTIAASPCAAQVTADDPRVRDLEQKLKSLTEQVTALSRELEALKTAGSAPPTTPPAPDARANDAAANAAAWRRGEVGPASFAEQVFGGFRSEQDAYRSIEAKPDVFLQTRYAAKPIDDAARGDHHGNFRVTRAAMRWAGRVEGRLGAGIELQYRNAPDGVPEQILNDAYLDFNVNKYITVRGGQFVKPFGFDVQQPDTERESPERAMFAGYVFPGERDRGVMLFGDLCGLARVCEGLSYALAVVNGNRMFDDSNAQVNYLGRARWRRPGFAIGGSVQLGTQVVPPGVDQTDNEHAFGVDAQWQRGPFALRGEFVHANRPSTRFEPDLVFWPGFIQGKRVRTVGETLTALWELDRDRLLYFRVDRLAGDAMFVCPDAKDGGCKINAVNGGFRQRLGTRGDVTLDLQWKDRLSFGYDAVNTRAQVTSSLRF